MSLDYFEHNAQAPAYDAIEYTPTPTFIVESHHRLGSHDHKRWTHLFNRYYEQKYRSISEATMHAQMHQFDRIDGRK